MQSTQNIGKTKTIDLLWRERGEKKDSCPYLAACVLSSSSLAMLLLLLFHSLSLSLSLSLFPSSFSLGTYYERNYACAEILLQLTDADTSTCSSKQDCTTSTTKKLLCFNCSIAIFTTHSSCCLRA